MNVCGVHYLSSLSRKEISGLPILGAPPESGGRSSHLVAGLPGQIGKIENITGTQIGDKEGREVGLKVGLDDDKSKGTLGKETKKRPDP